MTRIADTQITKIAVIPHGRSRARIFFGNQDYALYRDLLAERGRKADVEVWAFCWAISS